jgi:hypothetical protein
MDSKSVPTAQTYSYLALRRAVGWIGILLPLTLIAGDHLIFHEKQVLLDISLYYHTGMRDVFVGAVCAIALFLFYYRGYDKWDNIVGNLAGFCALGVAWFPTTASGPLDFSGKVHFICASVFFLCLAFFSVFLFTRRIKKPTLQKIKRNKIYVSCGIIMLVCLLAILIFFGFFEAKYTKSSFVFWAETAALVAFGISWLTKGGSLYPDKKT